MAWLTPGPGAVLGLAQSWTWQMLDGGPSGPQEKPGLLAWPFGLSEVDALAAQARASTNSPLSHSGLWCSGPYTATGLSRALKSWGCSWDKQAATQTHDERQEGRQPQERLWPGTRWEPNSIVSEAPGCFPFQEPLANLLRTRQIL